MPGCPRIHAAVESHILEQIQESLEKIESRIEQQSVARQAREIVRRAERDKARSEFDARGVLRPSFAVPAGPYGLRYKLQDPFTHKVAAYVEFPTELGVDVTTCVGKYVGVCGQEQTITGIGVSILRVTRLTVLNADGPADAPAREKPSPTLQSRRPGAGNRLD